MAQRVSELVERARAAIAACEGGALVAEALRGPHWRYCWVWAVGKAARAMARESGGALVIDPGVAGHPLPDERSVACAEQLLAAARAVPADERALLLLSGGASALVGAPVDGLGLDELQAATRALLNGGASIREINVVRRHLTRLGGGKLAAACPGAIDVLALSDVAGDDPATIGSGPASPEPATRAEALAIARRYGLAEAAIAALERAADNPRADHPAFARGTYRVLASPETLAAAAARALAGFRVRPWPSLVAGDVEDFAVDLAAAARSLQAGEAIVAVGEPTVRVRGRGTGGRAQHLALSMAAALSGTTRSFVAVGSDGRDGPTDAAGAFVDGRTLQRMAARGVDAAGALERCDSHHALAAVGALVPCFDSGTNLTDLYIVAC
ncbi:MAG: glycerate kinase type-2 family protein [Polyangia bacterium]